MDRTLDATTRNPWAQDGQPSAREPVVFVGPMVQTVSLPVGKRCALLPEDRSSLGLAALHAMAARLGIVRRKFRDTPSYSYYVMTATQRALAIRYGAIAVDSDEYVESMRRYGHAGGCLLSGRFVT